MKECRQGAADNAHAAVNAHAAEKGSAAENASAADKGSAKRVLIANRGEIACRVIGACNELGLESVAVFAKDDALSPHVAKADLVFQLEGEGPAETYNSIEAIVSAAKEMDCWAIHPGYGFLAEKAHFASAVEEAGIEFIGPRPETLALLGDKIASTQAARDEKLPILGQSDLLESIEQAREEAEKIGYPLLVKSPLGGGGLGCHLAENGEQLQDAFNSSASQGKNLYGSASVYLERYVKSARHIEVQTMGDGFGKVIHVGTRECSIQRRRQKVIEEAPAQRLSEKTREALHKAALRLAGSLKLRSAATVEFLVEDDEFWFLEVNPRIQVEHPVTELVYGVDLVKEQLKVALGEGLSISGDGSGSDGSGGDGSGSDGSGSDGSGSDGGGRGVLPRGYAIEARVYAEDSETFVPSPGKICCYEPPLGPGLRVESGVNSGFTVTPFYDPLLAKVIAWGSSKEEASRRLAIALRSFVINGTLKTNVELLTSILRSTWFAQGQYDTTTLEKTKVLSPLPDSLAELAAKLATYHDEKEKSQGSSKGTKGRSSQWKNNVWRSLP